MFKPHEDLDVRVIRVRPTWAGNRQAKLADHLCLTEKLDIDRIRNRRKQVLLGSKQLLTG